MGAIIRLRRIRLCSGTASWLVPISLVQEKLGTHPVTTPLVEGKVHRRENKRPSLLVYFYFFLFLFFFNFIKQKAPQRADVKV